MRLYLAAMYTNSMHRTGKIYSAHWNDRERAALDSVRHVLESYHYIKSPLIVKRMRQDGIKVFLDSGAFSAFTKGSKIDIKSYCSYIKDNLDIIEHFEVDGQTLVLASVLDAIGSAEDTWRNQRTMEDLGVCPLPCFHYGEPIEALEYYVQHYPYITLGGMVPISTSQLFYWLDTVWGRHLAGEDGTPRLRVHGFGLTSIPLMQRYPWYSVDSSSWIQAGINGGILLPGYSSQLYVSAHSSLAKKAGMHFSTLAEPHRQAIVEIVEAHGFDMERLMTSHYCRWAFNAHTFTLMMNELEEQDRSFQEHQPVLF
jgi:hypothetical protein